MKTSIWSRLRVLTWAVLCTAGTATSCSNEDDDKQTPPPPVELNDQIEYDGDTPVDIKSAIYEIGDEGLYTFYLSPTAGITDMEQMEAADDYLRVQVTNPKGTVDTASETFEISYRDISVKEATMKDVENVSLSADLIAETSRLNLYVEVEMKSGKTLLARYENQCSKIVNPVDLLNNEYDLNGTKQTVDNAVKRIDTATGKTTYILYHTENSVIGSPKSYEMTITLDSESAGTTADLSDPAKVSIRCEDFVNDENTSGTLTIEEQGQTLTLKLDAVQGDSYLRASYVGACPPYEGSNFVKVTVAEAEEAALPKVFLYNNASSSQLTFGFAEAEKPEDFMNGNYAIAVNISSEQLQDGTFDVSAKEVQFRLFDYVTYRTWDNSTYEGVTGTITTKQFGSVTYMQIAVEFPEGPKIESEWFGVLTSTTDNPDLTPVAPFRPHITITKPDGSLTDVDWDITELQLRHDPKYSDMGESMSAYVFYFVNSNTGNNGIDNTNGTPVLVIPDDQTNCNISDLKEAGDTFKWIFQFNNRNLSGYTGYGYNLTWMKRCPEKGSVAVEKVDKNWKITFKIQDAIDKGFAVEGTNNTLVIEWEGPATKYSGTKTNDLTDADY